MNNFKNIFAIETSGLYCSVALRSGEEIKSNLTENENEHGLVILDFIEDLLSRSNLKKDELDLIAVSNGPGSFTGLRVGCSVAQAIAFANDIPLIPLSSLAVLAYQAHSKLEKEKIFVVTNAHMKELYIGSYQFKKEEIKILKKECLINQEDLSNYVDANSKETFYVGNGIRFISNIEDKNTYENIFSQASNMFELIDLAIEQKSYVAAEEVSPNYLSGEDHWKKAN